MEDAIVRQQEVAAGADALWELIVTRDGRSRWLGLDADRPSLVQDDRFCWSMPWASDRPITFSGTVVTLVRPRLIALRWALDLSGAESRVEIGLAGADSGSSTTVTVRHGGFVESDMGLVEYSGYGHYWRELLDSLAASAEGRMPMHHHEEILSGPHFAGGHPVLGLYVRAVGRGSPVHVAGLRGGDWLQTVDGRSINSIAEYDDWLCHQSYGDRAVFGLARTQLDIELFAPPWDSGNGSQGASEPCDAGRR